MPHASFWKRTAAYLIDYIICSVLIGIILAPIIMLFPSLLSSHSLIGALLRIGICLAVFIGYYAWPESSSWQATLGKKLFGLKVTDLNGQRISFLRSVGRNLSMAVSAFILCIGFLMCIWTDKKQCLHDKMANCLVLDSIPNEKQGLAIILSVAVLVLYTCIMLGALLLVILLQGVSTEASPNSAAKAHRLIYITTRAQKNYYQQHASYATEWNLLDVEECQQQTGSICKVDDLRLTLRPEGILYIRWPGPNELKATFGTNEFECRPASTCQAIEQIQRKRLEEKNR